MQQYMLLREARHEYRREAAAYSENKKKKGWYVV